MTKALNVGTKIVLKQGTTPSARGNLFKDTPGEIVAVLGDPTYQQVVYKVKARYTMGHILAVRQDFKLDRTPTTRTKRGRTTSNARTGN